jgi:predicted Zn-dependent peptidase
VEVQRTVARMVSRYLREVDPVLGRATNAAVFEQQRGRAELLNELPGLLEAVTPQQIAAAAGTLRRDNRAVLELRPA